MDKLLGMSLTKIIDYFFLTDGLNLGNFELRMTFATNLLSPIFYLATGFFVILHKTLF